MIIWGRSLARRSMVSQNFIMEKAILQKVDSQQAYLQYGKS